MENKIKTLDCTLRDGGYINDWNFGYKKIKAIIQALNNSNIDFIELGFLSKNKTSKQQTLFKTLEEIEKIISDKLDYKKLCLMIKYRQFNPTTLPSAENAKIKNIRFIFKKKDIDDAIIHIKEIKKKGYNLFINLTYINEYTKKEIEKLKIINEINPKYISIVDTLGTLNEKQTMEIYEAFDKMLNEDIGICYHSHNNLQLSFSNAKYLIENFNNKRELIIDSSIFGMGRGAGNIQTEFLIKYLNENYSKNYQLMPILKTLNDIIMPIYNKTPWGYSIPYYLSAINQCHPDYAKFLFQNNIKDIEIIDLILKSIPKKQKTLFDSKLISNLLLQKVINNTKN